MSSKPSRRSVRVKKYQEDSQSDCDSRKNQLTTQNQIKSQQKSQQKYESQRYESKGKMIKKTENQSIKKAEIIKQNFNLKKMEDEQAEKEEEFKRQTKTKSQRSRLKKNEQKSEEFENSQRKKSHPKKRDSELPEYHKKKLKKGEKQNKVDEQVKQILEWIQQSYQADIQLYQRERTADKKLLCIIQISKRLKQVDLAKVFLKLDGILLFVKWLLLSQENGHRTCLTVVINVLKLILDLNLSKQNVDAAQNLEKVIKKYKKSKFSVLRDLSERIISKWNLARLVQSTN